MVIALPRHEAVASAALSSFQIPESGRRRSSSIHSGFTVAPCSSSLTTVAQQQARDLRVAVERSDVQRRVALFGIARLDVYSLVQQALDDLGPAVRSSRSSASRSTRVKVGGTLEARAESRTVSPRAS